MADDGLGAADDISHLSLGQGRQPPPPMQVQAPNIQSPAVTATDITEKFAKAVETLQPGELVKDGYFTLFDSVAALEIMDPKMDSGCIQPGEDFEVLYDVSQPLLPELVLGIIDQLICHEISWHLGYPLSQTIFTSVYVEALLMPEPKSIEQACFVQDREIEPDEQPMLHVLRAYCLGMLKACGHVLERIKSEHFYEEEDFVPNTYNRDLLTNFSSAEIQDLLTDAVERLMSLKGSIVSDEMADALIARLDLRSVFLAATESPQYVREPQKARASWDRAVELLPQLKATHTLGTAVDDAFSIKLQRKLTSTMPPRPIVQLDFVDAFSHLSRLLRDGAQVIGVLDYTNAQCLQTFVQTFQSKKPQPVVYVRTLLQTFLFDAMEILGSMSIRQLLDDDLSIITLPASPLLDRSNDDIEAVHDPRFVMSQQVELFRQRAAQPFLDVFRTACQNRCRVRRTLCHLIRDWENLQADAEDIDQVIQVKTKEQPLLQQSSPHSVPAESFSLPLSSWTFLYKVQQMEWIVQLGFELQIYQVDEMAGMYWYLNYLAKMRLQHTERIKTFLSRGPKVQGADQLSRSLAFSRLSLLNAAVTWELSDALCCVYTVLERCHLITSPPRPYSNDQFRFDLRMKPFMPISLPALPTFEEFTIGTKQPDASSAELLNYAERAVAGAKKGFEALSHFSAEESFSVGSHDRWTASAKGALRSCIATGIAISNLHKAILDVDKDEHDAPRFSVEIPNPDKAYHEWWIVPRLVQKHGAEVSHGQ